MPAFFIGRENHSEVHKMRLSIIIPAYITSNKGAEDLAVLLNKIANQIDGVNEESILVNDGSLIDLRFAKIVGITLIDNQQNLGVAVSRNVGIDNSRGRWINFIDADDDVPDDFVEILKDRIKYEESTTDPYDIIQFKARHEDGNIAFPEPCAWGKLIKSSWIGTDRFDPEQLIGEEDTLFLKKPAKIAHDDRIIYLHRQSANPDSLMKRFWRREIPRRKNTQQFADSEGNSERKEQV